MQSAGRPATIHVHVHMRYQRRRGARLSATYVINVTCTYVRTYTHIYAHIRTYIYACADVKRRASIYPFGFNVLREKTDHIHALIIATRRGTVFISQSGGRVGLRCTTLSDWKARVGTHRCKLYSARTYDVSRHHKPLGAHKTCSSNSSTAVSNEVARSSNYHC